MSRNTLAEAAQSGITGIAGAINERQYFDITSTSNTEDKAMQERNDKFNRRVHH